MQIYDEWLFRGSLKKTNTIEKKPNSVGFGTNSVGFETFPILDYNLFILLQNIFYF